MKLYKISRTNKIGYDEYDSAIVAAKSATDAITIHPSGYVTHVKNGAWMGTYSDGSKKGEEYDNNYRSDWVCFSDIKTLEVEFLGTTKMDRGLILASFNAG